MVLFTSFGPEQGCPLVWIQTKLKVRDSIRTQLCGPGMDQQIFPVWIPPKTLLELLIGKKRFYTSCWTVSETFRWTWHFYLVCVPVRSRIGQCYDALLWSNICSPSLLLLHRIWEENNHQKPVSNLFLLKIIISSISAEELFSFFVFVVPWFFFT